MICNTCRQELSPGEPVTIIHWNEGDERVHRDCTAAAVARAEAAEAHRTQTIAALRKALDAAQLWREAAWQVGEHLSDTLPEGYYGMAPETWGKWAVETAASLRAKLNAARWRLSATEKPAASGVEVDVRATGLYDEAGWSIYIDGDIVASYSHHHPHIEWRPPPPQK